MSKSLLDNGAALTLGLVGAVAAIGVANRTTGSRAMGDNPNVSIDIDTTNWGVKTFRNVHDAMDAAVKDARRLLGHKAHTSEGIASGHYGGRGRIDEVVATFSQNINTNKPEIITDFSMSVPDNYPVNRDGFTYTWSGEVDDYEKGLFFKLSLDAADEWGVSGLARYYLDIHELETGKNPAHDRRTGRQRGSSAKRIESFSVGDKVKHKREFLRSISWLTNVPRNGIVREITPFGSGRVLLTVDWSDGHTNKILDANVTHAGKVELA